MADNALAKQVGKKMPERRKTRLEQIADEIQAYGGRVRDDFMAGAERSAQGLGDIVERGDVLTGIPRLALGGTAWMGAPVSAALSPILNPILQPVGEAVNTYVGQPVEDLTGYPADITNDLAMTGLTLGAVKGLGMTRPYLARAADQVEGMANRAGYTLRKPANVYGSGPTLTPLVDEADGGLIAYHGSPHTFDKFSMDKIGTGEGAQAFGHGLYFAEAEDVAKTYRDGLAGKTANPLDMRGLDSAYINAAKMMRESGMDEASTKSALRAAYKRATEQEISAAYEAANPGSMYQVRLNVKPDQLVDWDMPYSAQSSKVREALDALNYTNDGDTTVGELFTPNIREGGSIGESLKARGIKGIRYFDGGSRAAGGGTYNYVIFDDSIIDILKRYGIPMTAAAGGGMMVMGQDMPPEVASQIGG
ncbi:MAG: hypothetical protein ACK52K_11360 [Alphaproteobacteria bacterium]|jgi:hypothetical protein